MPFVIHQWIHRSMVPLVVPGVYSFLVQQDPRSYRETNTGRCRELWAAQMLVLDRKYLIEILTFVQGKHLVCEASSFLYPLV